MVKTRSPLTIDCQNSGEKGRSRTKQEFKKTCDINLMVKKHKDINAPEAIKLYELSDRVAINGNFDMDKDYQSVIAKKQQLEKSWLAIPADIRKQHQNNPQNFLNFLDDPKNTEECYKRGYKKNKVKNKYFDKNGVLKYEIEAGLNQEQREQAIKQWEKDNGKVVIEDNTPPQ